jgi:hypothetical protein
MRVAAVVLVACAARSAPCPVPAPPPDDAAIQKQRFVARKK